MQKETYFQKKGEVRRQIEIAKRAQQKALSRHESFVDQHINSVRFIRKRVACTEKTTAAVEERLLAVYVRYSSLDQQNGERPKCLRDSLIFGGLFGIGKKGAEGH